MTIQESIQIYLKWKESTRIIAHKRYKIRLDQFANFITSQGKRQLEEINGDDVIAYHTEMKKSYSLTTVAYSASILKNFFWFWHGRNKISFSPKEIEVTKFKSPIKELVSKKGFDAINKLLKNDNRSDLQRKLAINLLWDTGMRVSELTSLKLADIKEPSANGLRTAIIGTRKTLDNDQVVWGEETNEILNCYLGIRLCIDTAHDELLINPKTGKPFTDRSIQRWVKELKNKVGIEKNITPHSFRHSKAHKILDHGGDVTHVAAILRHSSPESSFKYLRLNESKHLKTAGKYLGEALLGNENAINSDKRLLEQNTLLLQLLKIQQLNNSIVLN
ncbi:tyrosine-type recombinase/integrase [Winogradskyella haliclonae]|uniref:Tyrosine recombinase XerD n=1 Tax=Winogradskyella haliclonae TaxID=2048558 RepID=A0ABQ2C141_9FLAO|nr:tyrosine-type recombinase/integrase [Winogradskyella haliclonae]GGI58457.1 tyrosine recombinase XerD [Winogradskyella haliclonae]